MAASIAAIGMPNGQRTTGWELKAQRPGHLEGPVEVSIALGRPDNRKRDLDDNVATKAPLDLLVAHQVITDVRW